MIPSIYLVIKSFLSANTNNKYILKNKMQLKTHGYIYIATTNIRNYLKNTVEQLIIQILKSMIMVLEKFLHNLSFRYILTFGSYKNISEEADNSICTATIMKQSLCSIQFSKYYDCFLATYRYNSCSFSVFT